MDENLKRVLSTWGVPMVLFFIIALVCIAFIFAGVEEHYGDIVVSYPALYLQGQLLLAKSWERYPDYIIGLGIAAFISFAGAASSIYNMVKATDKK